MNFKQNNHKNILKWLGILDWCFDILMTLGGYMMKSSMILTWEYDQLHYKWYSCAIYRNLNMKNFSKNHIWKIIHKIGFKYFQGLTIGIMDLDDNYELLELK